MAAPFLRTGVGNVTSNIGTTGTVVTAYRPLKTRNGDMLLWVVAHRGPGSLSGIPSGWTEVTLKATATYTLSLLWHQITDVTTEPFVYTVTGATSARWITSMARVAGASTSFAGELGTLSGTTGLSTLTIPSVTTTEADELVIGVGFAGFTNSPVPPIFVSLPVGVTSAFTPLLEQTVGTSTASTLAFFTIPKATAGATGSMVVDINDTYPASASVGFAVALRSGSPATSEPTNPAAPAGVSPLSITGASTQVSTMTVPIGTLSSHYVAVLLAIGTNSMPDVSLSVPGGATVTDYIPITIAGSMSFQMKLVTGVVAGQTISATWTPFSQNKIAQLFVLEHQPGNPVIGSRSDSGSTTVAPKLGVTSGAGVLLLAIERSLVDGTNVTGVVSDSTEVFTRTFYQAGDADPDISVYWGKAMSTSGTGVGPVTLTYDTASASANGAAVLIPEISGTEAAPTISPTFGNDGTWDSPFIATAAGPDGPSAVGYKAAGPMAAGASHVNMVVPDGTVLSDRIYAVVSWGTNTPRVPDFSGTVGGSGTVYLPSTPGSGNINFMIQKFSGLAPGSIISADLPGAGATAGRIFVFDTDLGQPGLVARRSVSSTDTIIPGMPSVPSSPIYLLAMERTLADGSLVTNAVNAAGAPVDQLAYSELTGDPDISYYLGRIVPAADNSGQTTLTYNLAGGNGVGVLLPLVDAPAEISPIFEPFTSTLTENRSIQFTVTIPYANGLIRTNLGRPGHDRIRAKTLTKGAATVRLAVSTASNMASPVFSSSVTPDADGYSYLEVSGLTADTAYFYQVELAGVLTGTVNQVRTWPTPGVIAPTVGFLVGSCTSGYGNSNSTGATNPDTFSYMRAHVDSLGRSARVWVDLGDDIYPCSAGSPNGTVFPENVNYIRGWWEGQHQRSERAAFHKVIPTAHTYSDNDFIGSNSDSQMNPSVAALSNAIRRQVLCDALPLADPGGKGLYWSALLGRILIIHTDGRTFSSNILDPNDAAKSMLGATQKAWLFSQFARTDHSGIIWCHDNQWVGNPGVSTGRPGLDNWQTFAVERQEIADFVAANAVKLLLYMHGDNHGLGYDDGTNNVYGHWPWAMTAPVYQNAQAQSLAMTGGTYPLANANGQKYFTWVEITDTGDVITVNVKGIDVTTGSEVVRTQGTITVTGAPAVPSLKHEFHNNIRASDVVAGQ